MLIAALRQLQTTRHMSCCTLARPGSSSALQTLCFAPSLLATWVAASRLVDLRHFYSDVVAGSAIGALAALLGFSSVFYLPFSKKSGQIRCGAAAVSLRLQALAQCPLLRCSIARACSAAASANPHRCAPPPPYLTAAHACRDKTDDAARHAVCGDGSKVPPSGGGSNVSPGEVELHALPAIVVQEGGGGWQYVVALARCIFQAFCNARAINHSRELSMNRQNSVELSQPQALPDLQRRLVPHARALQSAEPMRMI